jgi:hypothetical protein
MTLRQVLDRIVRVQWTSNKWSILRVTYHSGTVWQGKLDFDVKHKNGNTDHHSLPFNQFLTGVESNPPFGIVTGKSILPDTPENLARYDTWQFTYQPSGAMVPHALREAIYIFDAVEAIARLDT